MSRITTVLLLSFALASTPHLYCQTSIADRGAALNALFKEVWQDDLKRSPEFASAIGDRRENDELDDISPRAFNDELARRRDFLTQLLAVDTAGLPEQLRALAETLESQLTEEEAAAHLKSWELPITPQRSIQTTLPAEVADWPFASIKDFDDYIARLKKVPAQLRQASENLLAGINDNRVETAPVIEKAIAETDGIAIQQPEASPFAAPLLKFPASIDAANRKRISADLLAAIQTDVLPAYVRFAKFLRVAVHPAAGQSEPALPPLGYAVREQEILTLRHQAQSALGPKFDLEGFHQIVADSGGLPIVAVKQRVDAWAVGRAAAK